MFERFTERARQVVVLAQDEARALKHNYIGTEHILLGLLREEEGLAARVLESLGFEYLAVDLDPARIRLARNAGDTVVFGDSADEELLRQVGLDTASAVIITFADPMLIDWAARPDPSCTRPAACLDASAGTSRRGGSVRPRSDRSAPRTRGLDATAATPSSVLGSSGSAPRERCP